MGLRKGVAAIAVGFLAFAACTQDEPALVPPPDQTEAAPAEAATVQAVDSEHGTILANANGETLYVFLQDEGGESTCYDQCEQTWPPLVADGDPVAGDGVTGELGTTERRDGSLQVTIAGSPLYTYAADTAPGDTNGQGVGGNWFVVAPDGTPIEE